MIENLNYSETDDRGWFVRGTGSDFGPNLADAVRMWPTPCAAEASESGSGVSHRGKGTRKKLLWHAKQPLLPTPKARDWRSAEGAAGSRRDSPDLNVVVAAGTGGQLNPTWVEWLMGFPIGYTALEPSGTPSSPRKSTRSSKRSPTSSEG
jgi:hypothetical protein